VSRCAERLNVDETTVADVFRASGYATGCFGKWHSGLQYPYHPTARGFDEFYGYCCGHWSHYFDATIEHNGVEAVAEGYLTDALTTKAIEFVREHRDRPFFCYLPLNTPHSPFQVPDRWYEKFAGADLPLRATDREREDLPKTRCALAMCENIDWNVGRVMAALEEAGLRNDTIVIYLSDNGPNSHRWNGGMTGTKGSCREGGVRSPCSITWPGAIPAGTAVASIAGAIDLLPTLADLCRAPVQTEYPLDGISLKPLLLGETADENWPDRRIFALQVGGYSGAFRDASVRTQRFRAYEDGRLFEPAADVPEGHDLAEALPEVSVELKAALAAYKASLPEGPINALLPVGYPEFPYTYLPAQDATPTGDITWSSVHPNCSWFTQWHNPEDTMSWDVDVHTAGSYRATLMYACREGDVGSTVELSLGTSSVRATIAEPFDPPIKSGFDRVPRRESYEKPFKPLELGVIELPAGRGDLVLRCVEKSGAEVCEVRTVKLELLG
jgi:hypothetical protein